MYLYYFLDESHGESVFANPVLKNVLLGTSGDEMSFANAVRVVDNNLQTSEVSTIQVIDGNGDGALAWESGGDFGNQVKECAFKSSDIQRDPNRNGRDIDRDFLSPI